MKIVNVTGTCGGDPPKRSGRRRCISTGVGDRIFRVDGGTHGREGSGGRNVVQFGGCSGSRGESF